MLLREKLGIIKESLFFINHTEKALPATTSKADLALLDEMDTELDLLLKEEEKGSLVKAKVGYVNKVIRLIILLDISGSMKGTENDIYLGLSDLIKKHKGDNILINFIAFNDDRYAILNDVFISSAEVEKIEPHGGTDLNGTLYQVVDEKCITGVNLLVTISDGADTEKKASSAKVREKIQSCNNSKNHFYFIGEPNDCQKPEDVQKSASELGFEDDHIAVFTREGNGNRLNFAVISKMLDDLIEYGRISNLWSEPIKEHYLALTDKRSK